MDALIAFSWHRCDTKPNHEMANHTVTTAKASGIAKYISSAVWCSGKTYNQLGDHRLSYDYLQEAYQLFNTLPHVDLESQRLGGQCGIDLVDVSCLASQDPGEVVSLAREVETKCAALSDELIHGRSLVFLGISLNAACQRKEALNHLEHARTMLKAVASTPNLSEACQAIARVHYDEQRLPEALAAIEEAWKHAEWSASPNDQANISLEFGAILLTANRDMEAWKHLEIALMKASYVGNRDNIVNVLEYMGHGYLRRGDYQNAYGAYEAAAEQYIGTVEAWREETCKDNMARIQQKQRSPDAVIGFYRHGLDVDQSLFYPPIQASASALPISDSWLNSPSYR